MSQDSSVATLPTIGEASSPIAKETNPNVKGKTVKEMWAKNVIVQYEDMVQHRLTPPRLLIEQYTRAKKFLSNVSLKQIDDRLELNLKEYNEVSFAKKVGPKYDPKSGVTRRHNKKGHKQRMRTPNAFTTTIDEYITNLYRDMSSEDKEAAFPWMNLIESFAIFSYQTYRAQNFGDILAAILACMKSNIHGKSLTEMVIEMTSLFDSEDLEESLETQRTPNSDEEPQPFFLTSFSKKFSALKSNRNFRNLSTVISGFASMIVADFKGYKWSVGTFSVLKVHKWCDLDDATDFLDAIIKTIDYFWTTGYRCIQEKSLDPLLFEDQTIQQFERDYTEVISQKSLAANGNLDDMAAYQTKVRDLLAKCKRMKNISYDGWLGHDLHQKYVSLAQIDEKLILAEQASTLRITPFGVSLYGDSSIGKSTLTTLLSKTVASAMGFKYDPKRCTQIDMKQRFEDTVRSDTQIIGFDDIANPKFGTTTTNPTIPVKKYMNTTEAVAEMSDVTQKGRVRPRPFFGWATTNTKKMDAHLYSNCPESILRVFLHATMVVNPKYRKNDSCMLNGKHPELLNRDLHNPPDDVWTFCLEEIFTVVQPDGKTTMHFKTFDGELQSGYKVDCEKLTLSQFLEVISVAAAAHMRSEVSNLEYNNNLVNLKLCACGLLPGFCKCDEAQDGYCQECKKPPTMCLCKIKDAVNKRTPNSFEEYTQKVATKALHGYLSSFFRLGGLEIPLLKSMATSHLVNETQDMLSESMTPVLLSVVPLSIVKNPWIQMQINHMYTMRVYRDVRWHVRWFFRFLWLLHIIFLCMCPAGLLMTLSVHAFSNAIFWVYKRNLVKNMWNELNARRDALPYAVKKFRDARFGVSSVLAGVGAGMVLLKAYNFTRQPNSSEETDHLSKKSVDSMPSWMQNIFSHKTMGINTSREARTAVLSQVEPAISQALWSGAFLRQDNIKVFTSVFCLTKNVILFPRHNFYKDANMNTEPFPSLVVTIQRNNSPGGHIRPFVVEYDSVHHVEGADFVAAYVPNCPSMKPLEKWFPLSLSEGSADAKILWRGNGGQCDTEKVYATFGKHAHSAMRFDGCIYDSISPLSNQGTCMSPLLNAGKNPSIIGFHLGSQYKNGKYDCVAGSFTRSQYDAAIADLSKRFPIGAHAGTLPEKQCGMEVLRSPNAHAKAYAGTFPPTASFQIHGSTNVRAQTKSRVIASPLAKYVKEIFDLKVEYGPPDMMPNWKPFNETLDHAANPELCYPPYLLEKAKQDWLRPLRPLVRAHAKDEIWQPLTLKQGIMGVPGVRFLDALDMKTSMGFPVLGPKAPWFTDVIDDNGLLVDRIPDPSIVEEMDRMMACWEKGERAYPIMRACLKDEPAKIPALAPLPGKLKTKVRVFQSCPVAFSILVRMYFLPVIRFMACHPRETECAVGVNCMSRQWDQLMEYAERFGVERTLALDYSKYDVGCSSQVTAQTLAAKIELACEGGYEEKHLKIMTAMISDICHPMIDWNGTLIEFFNMVISGVNITVQMNSIANSFYMRMHFFATYPEAPSFREAQAVITYGDDKTGTVNKDFPKITFKSYQSWLAGYGKKITPPDKGAEATDYMPGADFLKRKSNFVPEIGTRVGALDEASMFKCLLANLESKSDSAEDVARSSVCSVMHEAFALGREKYDDWLGKLRIVCEQAEIPCKVLDITFDERVEDWKNKYGSSSGTDPVPNEKILT